MTRHHLIPATTPTKATKALNSALPASHRLPQRLLALLTLTAGGASLPLHAQTLEDPKPALGAPKSAAANQLPTIEITGRNSKGKHAGGQLARSGNLGLLGEVEVMDTPFSVMSYTAQTVADQQATSAAEVIGNNAAVRFSVSPGGMLDAFYIRGFPVNEGNQGEFAFDGVFGVAPSYRVFADYLERIELVKGPTALLNGMAPNGAIGGTVNLQPKRAGSSDVTQLGLEYSEKAQLGARLDVSRRFGPQKEWGARLNTSLRKGQAASEKQDRHAKVLALALDYQGSRLSASLDLLSQDEHFDAPNRPVFLAPANKLPQVPAAPSGNSNLSNRWEWSSVADRSALLRADYEFTSGLNLFANLGSSRTGVERFFGNPMLSDAAGKVAWTPTRFSQDIERGTANLGARIKLRSGPVEHALSLQFSRYEDRLSRGQLAGTALSNNLYAPVENPKQNPLTPPQSKTSESRLSGLAMADTLSLLERRLMLSLGARVQQIHSDNFNPTGKLLQRYEQSATTPFVGLVLKPWGEQLSVYTNLMEGLSKGDVAPSNASNAGEVLPPYRSKQLEAGLKYESGGMSSTLALFQISKPSGLLNEALVYSADGEQRNRGLELESYGELSPGLRLMGSLALLQAKVTRSSVAAYTGKQALGVPKLQANLSAEWSLPQAQGFTLNGGLAYAGTQYVDAGNLRQIPAWWRADIGARWQGSLARTPLTLRANVRNLFNRSYWAGVSSFGGMAQASARSLQVSASADF